MERQALLDAIMVRMGATRVDDAERALAATLPALGSWIGEGDAAVLAAEIPDGERLVGSPTAPPVQDVEELFDRIQRVEGVAEGFAREHGLAVCHAIHDALSPEARERLTSPAWDVVVRPSVADRHAPQLHPRHGHTLADGRPGSKRPVSEAATKAHRASVVRSDNPHGDRKLSSGEPRAGQGVDWEPPITRDG